MPTLREVAEKAGVSTVTASSVLSGANRVRVSTATQDRIRRIAREMNYVPRAAARGLRTGRTQTIAFLTSGQSRSRWQPYWQDMLRGVSDVLWDRDEKLVLGMPRSREDEVELLRQLAFGKQVDGLLIQDAEEDDERIALLAEAQTPYVVIGGNPLPEVNQVLFDSVRFAQVLVDRLLATHGALAVITGRPGGEFHGAFRQAGERAAERDMDRCHVWSGAYLPGAEWFRQAAAKSGDGTFGVLLTRHLLPELRHRLGEADLTLGEDTFVSYLSGGETLLVPLPGIDVLVLDHYTLGRRAAKRLFHLIDEKDGELPPERVLVFPNSDLETQAQ